VSVSAAATPVAAGAPGLKNPLIGNHKLWVTVVPPASTGTPIVGYTVTLTPGGATRNLSGAAGGQVLFTGLVNGAQYTASVEAEYASIAGPTGPSMAATPMTVPSAPKFHVRRTPTKLALKLVAPKNNGGAVVKSYRVVISGPGLKKPWTFTLAAKKKKLTVYGLRPSTRYKVTITAVNAAGRSKGFKHYVRTKKAPVGGLAVADLAGHPFVSGVTVNIGADAAFAADSATMTPRMVRLLTVLAKAGKGHKTITCTGYADFGGVATHDYQLALSRAQAVCSFLKAHHAAVRTTVVSFGGTRPLVVKGTQKSRATNRRVTITFG
jgi:outer membrane protein OmpA-like peptidoglycan-associated protein